MPHCDVLVSPEWAEGNLGAANLVFVEADEDTSAYDVSHIPGAGGRKRWALEELRVGKLICALHPSTE